MTYEHIKQFKIITSLLVVIGMGLMFLSVSFGTAIGDSWLQDQGGFANTSNYERTVETHINNFVIIGSILFGAGVLTGLATFYLSTRSETIEERDE
ncbi:hypothetical protein FIU87_02775 [Bacillus sp. THAF10]|uniref:hypothetical protein n=1 Tax=Bacillus sp. THAF10 TaxID=2587848 RepID=UPI001267D6B6|nr:hypothetical protein [Bacillus sp. THAF10]QFT87565.1 hypothetical protein FIU87_02775 [Bacillus sp. THAF10]